jgi:hypothetical protein
MKIFSPELVAKASELPSPALLTMAVLGPLFWVLGWRIHRVLFVAAVTVTGGLYGLFHGPAFGLDRVVAASLLSVSAAALSLALIRVGVFMAFGVAAGLGASVLVTSHFDEHMRAWLRAASFFVGGLFSLICYRFLIILITSFVGAFLLLLGGLGFAAQRCDADTVALATQRPTVVSAAWVALGLIGAAGQYWTERARAVPPAKAPEPEAKRAE